ncbi:MAG: hypothetical protein COU42_02720 [Candidatus Nealsonbacteria bacterium CG10_big_fil_rev_8_21_14_0_10_36_24]|uniref:HTH HARE-type domain-containing protein n=2 Tax=Candidatus Nealsoniibacteriota TaxID=1817911 RepID=A0A2H0YPB4_9BACT|nr:MAG: hypothetical protein COU42_02720 [Candidatus Nealsonbacteria bacterium CG10_big_fil_rev_8_21_14_0_10_36_24]PIS40344.1 MAG: hypothetical protein COT32_00235 [Candidatus Nealsonbacteria bacterium CG08_land_8_20_14_0_20_36_22]
MCSDLIKDLSPRTADVIERRFGLKTEKRETLEAIGESYGRTRERIRQLEEEGFSKIRKKIKDEQDVFQYFNQTLELFGGIKKEVLLFNYLVQGEKNFQNQIRFLLILANEFRNFPEDDNFYSFWFTKKNIAITAKKIAKGILRGLKKENRPIILDELFKIQEKDASKIWGKGFNKDIFLSCLEISKNIGKNPEELYGLKNWLEINPRGMKNKAYLVFKKEKRPLHFTEVVKLIEKLPFPSEKQPNLATVHNELIRDSRFVLVGRGLYALKEWGYESGFVKDIIYKTLKGAKRPLTKQEILERVLKQRFVKENTIFLNLQDGNYFARDKEGRYTIREA